MREAIRISLTKMRGDKGGPFGAVVVRRDKIIGRGWNRVTSTNDPTAHAEVVAIRDACRRLKTFQLDDCELYTSCEPCPMCLAATWWARIGEIVFAADRDAAARAGFDDAAIYQEVASDREVRSIPCRQHLADEGEAPFRAWAANPARQPY